MITLTKILSLVGRLDDTPGDDVPRERFRQFLKENLKEIGQIRDYIDECLRKSGDQYNKALQDLVNYLGEFLGFEVTFGRYKGVYGEIGYDGLWRSPTGFYLVIEVKTTEAYAIKTTTLVGYINSLISQKVIPDWDHALGLYVIGRPDSGLNQLENSIIAEKRTNQLRIISVESLISLAEAINEYEISHEDILGIIKPSGPTIDHIAGLISRLLTRPEPEIGTEEEVGKEKKTKKEIEYWLAPVRGDKKRTAEEIIKDLIGEGKVHAIGERTPGRKHLKAGDLICFYASGIGVVAHAKIASTPERKTHPKIKHPEQYPWVFQLKDVKLYFDNPVVIDTAMRISLEAFRGIDPNKAWGWFVTSIRKLSENDFKLLTRQIDKG
ncbi:MAG: EVE domain-containing protein [Acidobacteria bacterium]|nr:EVE domain-containing protein [Acidobacteriota bacterium]